jgi:hypothetical protein
MEFAITALVHISEADDSWMPMGARSFLFFGEMKAINNVVV